MKTRTAAPLLAMALMAAATAATAAAPGQPAAGPSGMAVPASSAVIAAPATVDAGQTVNVVVNGAPQGSAVELWGPVTEAGRGERIASSPLVGGTARLVAPARSASYELRYVGPNGAVQARQAFDVAAVPVALSVSTPTEGGAAMEVAWQGPASPGDRFEIVGQSGAVVDTVAVDGDAGAANVTTLTVPQEPGSYRLRYVTGQGAELRSVGFDVR